MRFLLSIGWNPDLHPRWPKGTPRGGQFMRVTDLFSDLSKSISRSRDVSFLAKGSQNISRVTASVKKGSSKKLEVDVRMKNGGSKKLVVDSNDNSAADLVSSLKQLDAGGSGDAEIKRTRGKSDRESHGITDWNTDIKGSDNPRDGVGRRAGSQVWRDDMRLRESPGVKNTWWVERKLEMRGKEEWNLYRPSGSSLPLTLHKRDDVWELWGSEGAKIPLSEAKTPEEAMTKFDELRIKNALKNDAKENDLKESMRSNPETANLEKPGELLRIAREAGGSRIRSASLTTYVSKGEPRSSLFFFLTQPNGRGRDAGVGVYVDPTKITEKKFRAIAKMVHDGEDPSVIEQFAIKELGAKIGHHRFNNEREILSHDKYDTYRSKLGAASPASLKKPDLSQYSVNELQKFLKYWNGAGARKDPARAKLEVQWLTAELKKR